MYQTTRDIRFELKYPKSTGEPVDIQVLRGYEAENAGLRQRVSTLESQLKTAQSINSKLDSELTVCKGDLYQLSVAKQLEYRRHEKALIELKYERDASFQQCASLRHTLDSYTEEAERVLASSYLESRQNADKLERLLQDQGRAIGAKDKEIQQLREQILVLNYYMYILVHSHYEQMAELAQASRASYVAAPSVQSEECHNCDALRTKLTDLNVKLDFAETALLKQVDLNYMAYEEAETHHNRSLELEQRVNGLNALNATLNSKLQDAEARIELDRKMYYTADAAMQLSCRSDLGIDYSKLEQDGNIYKRKIELLEYQCADQQQVIRDLKIRCAGESACILSASGQAVLQNSQLAPRVAGKQRLEGQQLAIIQASQKTATQEEQIQAISLENAQLKELLERTYQKTAQYLQERDLNLYRSNYQTVQLQALVEQFKQQLETQNESVKRLSEEKANLYAYYSLYRSSALAASSVDKLLLHERPEQYLLDKTSKLSAEDAALIQFVKENHTACYYSDRMDLTAEVHRLTLENYHLYKRIAETQTVGQIVGSYGDLNSKALYAEYQRISYQLIEYVNNIHFQQQKIDALEDQNIELNRVNKELIARSGTALRQDYLNNALIYLHSEHERCERLQTANYDIKREMESMKQLIDAYRKYMQAPKVMCAPYKDDFQQMLLYNRVRYLESELEQVRQLKGSYATLQQYNSQLLQSLSYCERAYSQLTSQSIQDTYQKASDLARLKIENEELGRKIEELSHSRLSIKPAPAEMAPYAASQEYIAVSPQGTKYPYLDDLASISPSQAAHPAPARRPRPDYDGGCLQGCKKE